MSKRLALVVGTRPEVIKMAPVIRKARETAGLDTVVIASGQHQELVEHMLDVLEVVPDIRIESTDAAFLTDLAAGMLHRFGALWRELQPDAVLVQGDTTTVLAASLAAFYESIPVGHVEAGLRTGDFAHPFPEEANRVLVDRIARWLFAPTEVAADNLRREGAPPERIVVTGNTGIDSLLWMLDRVPEPAAAEDLLLITLHRRESAGDSFREILHGVLEFLVAHPEARAEWPIHPNPIVAEAIDAVPGVADRIDLVDPLPYDRFVALMGVSRAILTDSGGIQEEAPSLGKPVLVVRETTERPEGLEHASNWLVGRSRRAVADALEHVWSLPTFSGPLPAPNPFGDGHAAQRILDAILG